MRKRKEEVIEEEKELQGEICPVGEVGEPCVVVEEAEVKEVPEYCILGQTEKLEDVAKKYGLTVSDLQGLNNNATIMPGNQVRVR